MSLIEALQLIGYSLGAVLPLWMGYLLFKQRLGVVPMQRLLLALGFCMVGWHAGNLIVTVSSLLGLEPVRWDRLLRIANTTAVVSITVCYSLLLHVHIHLWATSQGRRLTRTEQLRIYLSYIPCLFLLIAVPPIWTGPYQPLIAKLSPFVLPFALWVTYSLSVVAITELMVAQHATSQNERRILKTLAASFIGIGVLILLAIGLGLGQGTVAGQYLQTLANLGSLLPSALLAYYIYRYRFLELIIKESLIVAVFAAVVLAVYLFGIRRAGEWANARYGLRAGVVEAILILCLTLLAAPLRAWLEQNFRALFERETSLYRDVVSRIGAHAGRYRNLSELLGFIEQQSAAALSLRRLKIVLFPGESDASHVDVSALDSLRQRMETAGKNVLEDDLSLDGQQYLLAYGLSREDKSSGALLVDASPNALTPDVRAVLEVLAGQIAIAIEDWRLAAENLRLERKLAEGERLAALGQMAATVAHEVKNPLSAIKSIAQVMSEDEALKAQHARDLSLIVSETDRLSKSVTQLLSFASRQTPSATPGTANEVLESIVSLFRVDAAERKIALEGRATANVKLDGVQTAAVRDALANLVLNALQATAAGGRITGQVTLVANEIVFSVADTGPGVSPEVQKRMWEPFFTTRQRGTGLGLAIVRKRMEEAGGSARLVPTENGKGARFELRLPLKKSPGKVP